MVEEFGCVCMGDIDVYLRLWEALRSNGTKTIGLIDNVEGWDFRVNEHEYTVQQTFYHAVQAIFEDAGNWFLNESTKFTSTKSPTSDLNRVIDRMMDAIRDFSNEQLSADFTFQWGEQTTVEGAIHQNLFHAVGHFSQIRNWIGIYQRLQTRETTKTFL
jgi:hypothetical protein